MPTEIIMPKVDMVMETGTFVEWLIKEGDPVKKGNPLFVIMTDKAAIEVEATADGILAGVCARADDVIPVTQVIGYILAPGEKLPHLTNVPSGAASTERARVLAPVVVTQEDVSARDSAETAAEGTLAPSDKVRATPVARRLAQELGVDLAQVAGRGPRGRIHKADVLAFQATRPSSESAGVPASANLQYTPSDLTIAMPSIASVIPFQSLPLPDARLGTTARKQVVPMAGARKIIAERMSFSAFTAPHIHLSLRVDMTEAVRLRERVLEPVQAQTGQRVSYTAILARAVASVLPRHPYLNASLDMHANTDSEIILWEDVHLGIATSVDENLIVPVIREAQNRSLRQIVSALVDLTERARSRRLTPAEMTGSTFTISNLGMYGIESFTAIINPPEAAILAVGKMIDMPVAFEGQIALRPMMEITACADHRIADGATVARFLADLKETLENPYLLI